MIRLIGGRGYRLGCIEPELHGVVEHVAADVRLSRKDSTHGGEP
jgi:hypothetical protein